MKRRNLNFRQSRSERSGDSSYSNFRKSFVKMFKFKSKVNQNPKDFERRDRP